MVRNLYMYIQSLNANSCCALPVLGNIWRCKCLQQEIAVKPNSIRNLFASLQWSKEPITIIILFYYVPRIKRQQTNLRTLKIVMFHKIPRKAIIIYVTVSKALAEDTSSAQSKTSMVN